MSHGLFRQSKCAMSTSDIALSCVTRQRMRRTIAVVVMLSSVALTPAVHAQSEAAASMRAAAQRSCPPVVGSVFFSPTALCPVANATDEVLLSLAPIQFAVFNTLAIQANQQFQAAIRDQLGALRESKPGDVALPEARQARYATFTPPAKSYRAGGEAIVDQTSASRWGSFVTAQGARGRQDQTEREAAFAGRAYSLIGGGDYRFTPSFVVGGALGYQYNRSSFDFDRGSIAADSYTASVFSSWSAERGWYVDGLVSYSLNRYDNTRNFTSPTARETARSTPNGDRINALGILGYSIYRGPYTMAPFLTVNFVDQRVDSFSESGPSTFNLNVAAQSQISLSSSLGVQANRAFSTSWGVLSLSGRAEWKHEFRNNSQVLQMAFQADPVDGKFFVPTDAPDRNYYVVGIGAAAQFAAGKSAFLQYETVLGLRNVTNNVVSTGVRIEF